MIIAVSDLHLGDPLSNEKGFMSFIQDYLRPNQKEITHLVLLGDILDLWKKSNIDVIQRTNHIFNALASLDFESHYLVGNHDFALVDKKLAFNEDFETSMDLTLTDGNSKYRFIHGHQLNYWYVLPFYEVFSNAMCHTVSNDETSAVWNLLKRNQSIPIDLKEKINALSQETKTRIEDRLAGPLIGQDYTINEVLNLEYEILGSLINLETFQTKNPAILREAIEELSSRVSRLSGRKLFYQTGEISQISEIAKKYLAYWTQILQRSKSNDYSIEFEGVYGLMKRIAAMFSIDLNSDEYLIHGHGHKMKVDQENWIADTGCWIGDNGSFISINGRYVESIRWLKA